MLEQITKIAQTLNEIDAKNIQMTLDENKINQIKVDLKSHFGMFGLTPPNLYENEDLEISIWGVQFNIKEDKKPDFVGKFKLANPSMLVDLKDSMVSINQRLQKSFIERENQIWDAFANGKEDLIDWVSKNKSNLSSRLHNAIIRTKSLYGLTLDELTWEEFNKYRGCGKVSWDEFVKLRGY